MNLEMILIAFGAGVVTFFNPCGFALLPAYVSHYLGQQENRGEIDTTRERSSWQANCLQGLKLGLAVSAGFFTVFGLLGLLISLVGGVFMGFLGPYLPWIAATIGGVLVILGLLMLLGSFSISFSFNGLLSRFFKNRAGHNGLTPYYFYGISYAVGSAGCTLPIFLIWVIQPLLQGFIGGLLNFLAYASGMASMMLLLSLVMSISKGVIQRNLAWMMRYVQKAASLVMIGAGSYLVYYNLIYSGLIRI
ncbi:hypothetical protein HYR53_01785 [Candidatus Acetothermia bacterium]|nr:hypothetical protein [Candidatus Acetothermia bacterium]